MMASKVNSDNADNNEKLKPINDVEIEEGTFKYVLIKVKDRSTKQFKHIVRGFCWADFHADIYEDVEEKLHKEGVQCSCPGGGRIKHSPSSKTISVYGYSQGYGRPDHSITVEILKKHYPQYEDITWSNDGY
ncbi:14 kDa phosphohistidine phosphatase-like [Lineus longissimus]|uniref:14 kDa phosphohistidine phosphatase-like n=1 Tax=Lineus longissimus TaxID=88925 RepID=UPI002B4E3E54